MAEQTAELVGGDQATSTTDGASASTQVLDNASDPETIASKPEIQEAFSKVFGGDEAASEQPTEDGSTPTQSQRRQQDSEEADELEGLEGAQEEDGVEHADGVEEAPKEDDEPEAEEEAAEEDEAGDGASTLDPLLAFAAKRGGFSDEDIADFMESNPEAAVRTFTKLRDSYNDLTSQYGRLGEHERMRQPDQAPPVDQTAHTQQRSPGRRQEADQLTDIYGEEALKEIEREYEPAFIEKVLKPLVAPVHEAMELARAQQAQAVGQEIDSFFKGLPEDLGKIYGVGSEATADQVTNRNDLAQLADNIRTGAQMQGVNLTVSDALERANMMFASKHLVEIERKKIKKAVQKRSKSITARPSQRRRPSRETAPSEERATSVLTTRMKELGLSD